MPDWEKDAIDSKWRWIVPWGLCSAGLLVTLIVSTSIWNTVVLDELSRRVFRVMEVPLKLANEQIDAGVDEVVVRVDESLTLHVGDVAIPMTSGDPPIMPSPRFPDVSAQATELKPPPPWRKELADCLRKVVPPGKKKPEMVLQVASDEVLDWILQVSLVMQPFSAGVPRLRVEKERLHRQVRPAWKD